MEKRLLILPIVTMAAVAAWSCGGPGKPAQAVRADRPTASGALGGGCLAPGEDAAPWVIDLEATDRGKLRGAITRGVVVVAYDCKKLKILDGCKVSGSYAYQGTGFNEDTLHLDDVDAVRATLSNGAAFAAKIEADMKRGTKIFVGYAVVGESNTTLRGLSRAQLQGPECKDATHFIANASLGAFRMTTSTQAEVGSAAEVFGQGVSADSKSTSALASNSGKRDICQKATSSDVSPLNDCDSLLKIRLVAIHEGDTAPASYRAGGVQTPAGCAAGTTRSGNICVSDSSSTVKTCKPGNAAACEESCKKGDATSCALAGLMYEKAKGVSEDPKKAMGMYEAACQKRNYDGCAGMGFLFSKGLGVPADKAKAEQLFKESCDKGNARACSGIGHQLRLAKDESGAIRWFDRSCQLGYARACFYAGAMLMKKGDAKRALESHARACQGDDPRGCLAVASLQSSGAAGASDTAGALANRDKGLKELDKRCTEKDADACEALGDYYMGVYDKSAKKAEKAIAYYGTACGAGVYSVCMDVGKIYEKGEPPYIKPDKSVAMRMYEVACLMAGDAEGCKKSGKKPLTAGGTVSSPTPATKPARRTRK